MDRKINFLVIGIVIGLIAGGTGGYLIAGNIGKRSIGRGNFQIDEKAKAGVTSFFEGTSDMAEIRNYCGQNRMNCFYYCRSINPNHEICNELANYTSRGGVNGINNQA